LGAADHLQVPRQHGLFTHHGIDLGDGTVAHYLEGREILRSPVEEFSRGQPLSVVTYPTGSCSPTGVTLRRAMGRIGEQRYNLLFNNCEHFAHWCKTGRHRSSQVEDWMQTGSRGAGAVLDALRSGRLQGSDLLGAAQELAGLGAAGLVAWVRQLLQERLSGSQREKGMELALQALGQLDGVRRNLQERLEQELAKAEERWGEIGSETGNSQFAALRQAAQKIADQLAEVEELEARLERRLDERSGDGEAR
jgi:hypothetical protein